MGDVVGNVAYSSAGSFGQQPQVLVAIEILLAGVPDIRLVRWVPPHATNAHPLRQVVKRVQEFMHNVGDVCRDKALPYAPFTQALFSLATEM
jgi:hypothetical protein